MEVFPSIEDLRSWADRLEEVQGRLAPYFERAEPRQRAMAYIRGLVGITERKNGWQLAELAGEGTPDGMQRLLNTAHWDADQVRDDLQEYILTHLSDPEAVPGGRYPGGATHHDSQTDAGQADARARLCPWSEGRLGDG